jgi:hypothetical protein
MSMRNPAGMGLPTPMFDLLFILFAVMILTLGVTFRNKPGERTPDGAAQQVASIAMLPRAPGRKSTGNGGSSRVNITATRSDAGGPKFVVSGQEVPSYRGVRSALERLTPGEVVIHVDTRTPPDPLTVAINLMHIAQSEKIPARLAYKPEVLEGGNKP